MILLTGFKPFSTFKKNPSGEIAKLLDGAYFKGEEVRGLELDVTHEAIKNYLDELKNEYSIIINTGLAAGRSYISVEVIAVNWQSSEKDENNFAPPEGKIIDNGPDGIFSSIPVRDVLHTLRSAKIPSKLSFTAGTFLCNKIFYYSLYNSKAKVGFIHLPATDDISVTGEYPTMEIEKMIKSIELTIQKTL